MRSAHVVLLLVLLGVAEVIAADGAAPLAPVPPEAEQATRLKALKDIYKDEYARRKPEERAALARKLFAQGLATADDVVVRFVFLREAQDLAAKSGDLDLGVQALDALSASYAVDAVEDRLRFYAAIAPAISSIEAARVVIDAQLVLATQAIAVDEYPLAIRAATQADGFARRLKDADLPVRTQAALDLAKSLASEYAALGQIRDLLGEFTPAGHAKYGRFACLSKSDWETGLVHLAQGDDEALKGLAVAEAAATTAETRLACADAWYDWALKQKVKPVRSAALAHAGDLYRRVLPEVTGLVLARVDKRLADLEKLIGARAGRYPDGAVLLLTFEAMTGGNVLDQSPHRHQVRLAGAKPIKGPWGGAVQFDGEGGTVSIANHPSLQITGSSTLLMWLKPSLLGERRNPWNKSYGGEGTWTLEPSGILNAYHGVSGADDDPYASIGMPAALKPDQWAHVAFVRDIEAKVGIWYRNGTMVANEALAYLTLKPSANDITLGGGYAGDYAGLIDEVGLWPRALSAKDVKAVYEGTAVGRN